MTQNENQTKFTTRNNINIASRQNFFDSFHSGFNRNANIDSIAIHGSAGGASAQALFNWWRSLEKWLTFEGDINSLSPSEKWSYDKAHRLARGIGFYHYIIDRQSEIYKALDENKWSYHSHSGQADSQSIAICLVNPDTKNASIYTDEQYHSLHVLIYDILDRHQSISKIQSHVYRAWEFSGMTVEANGLTPCPGEKFHWELIEIFNDRVTVQGVV